MATQARPLAVVTGASTGIGLELAKICAQNGMNLVVAADEPGIHDVASQLRAGGITVDAVEADLSTTDGVDQLYGAIGGRPVAALLANAGRGLGRAFVEQDWGDIRHVIDTNVTGTVYLVHQIARDMKRRGEGRILIVGSIAGLMPGSFQAVYNGTKAFLDSFSIAIREELKDTSITVSCLLPGATETEFFERADLMDTKVGTEKKMDAAKVAQIGFDAMMKGEASVVAGLKNKLQAAASNVLPDTVLAAQHAKQAAPGTAKGR